MPKKIVLLFETLEDVTPEIFARRITEACAQQYALKEGESVVELTSGMKFTYVSDAKDPEHVPTIWRHSD